MSIVSSLLSCSLLCLNTYLKNYDLGSIAQKHSEAATALWDIRESYLSLLTDYNAGIIDAQSAIERRDRLQARLVSIYKCSPRTICKAYQEATTALKKNEEMTFSDQEIDVFLPTELRHGTLREEG